MLRFIISQNDCQSVLGKYACVQLRLIKRVFSINLDRYYDLFHELGKLSGVIL